MRENPPLGRRSDLHLVLGDVRADEPVADGLAREDLGNLVAVLGGLLHG